MANYSSGAQKRADENNKEQKGRNFLPLMFAVEDVFIATIWNASDITLENYN